MEAEMIRKYVLKASYSEKQPIVFNKLHAQWIPVGWSLQEWKKFLSQDELGFTVRAGLKDSEEILWESKCKRCTISWEEIVSWDSEEPLNVEKGISNKSHWLYYDYKYMHQLLDKKTCEMFAWDAAGFSDRDGENSTLWIGTRGSYTPMHYDTYGCNLVTQVYGSKTWILFPPSSTVHLKPSRIPYEESSVYSLLDLKRLSPSSALKLSNCSALEVTLHPGDVLFVPPQWWHHVSSNEFSISVNTWIELPQDVNIRMDEAILRSVVGAFCNLAKVDTVSKVLNPNELDMINFNEQEANEILEHSYSSLTKAESEVKRTENNHLEIMKAPMREEYSISSTELLNVCSCAQTLQPKKFEVTCAPEESCTADKNALGFDESPVLRLLNAIGHPHVLSSITERFKANMANESK